MRIAKFIALGAAAAVLVTALASGVQTTGGSTDLDSKVSAFLQKMSGRWRDMNVPEQDGRVLHDLIVENGYTRGLEIGTSTGLSGIYIAWGLSKTGGRLITLELESYRRDQALAHFRETGLDGFIDSRLGDAHELVPALEGPFDFVFIDADKDWYVQYAKDVIPKLAPGGCIAAHNVSGGSRGGRFRQGGEYYDYMNSLPGFETRIHPQSRGDLAVSFKKKI